MAQMDGFDRLFRMILAHTRARGEPAVSMDSLCAAAVTHLGVSAVAVTAPVSPGGAVTLGVAGASARELEELQVTVGEGPSLIALADGVAIHLTQLRTDLEGARRWPIFVPAALALGVESLHVLPMRVGAARFGVLALYLHRPAGVGPVPLGPEQLADAEIIAGIALDLMLAHVEGISTYDERDPLQNRRFFDDRPEIHQATGMVSVQLRVDLGTALLRIRARAYAESRQLSEFAADVVARKIVFAPEQ